MEQLFEVLHRVTSALRGAAIEHRVVGGMAVFLHVSQRDPLAARVTRDIDLAVDRKDLDKIAEAVPAFGFEYRYTAGVDMLVDAVRPGVKSAVHLNHGAGKGEARVFGSRAGLSLHQAKPKKGFSWPRF